VADQLPAKIREARRDAGMKREHLAVALGVSLSTIVRWETGRTNRISVNTVAAIAKATGKPLPFFFEEAAA
jgi:transcriptional regulator with XRE-family HTH domain